MALALVVEDGTGLADSNSYVSTDYVRNYAAFRGVSLPADDDALIPFMINAMDWLEAYADDFIAAAVSDTQALSWPRLWPVTPPVYDYGFGFGEIPGFGFDSVSGIGFQVCPGSSIPQTPILTAGVVPVNILNAQAALAVINSTGQSLSPVDKGAFVISKKVGPLETKYSERLSTGVPTFSLVDKLIANYLEDKGNYGSIRIQRG
jgi:hypothetical protein